MREHEITIHQTHIEVSNYQAGDLPEVELEMSKKNKAAHCLEPTGYYVDESTDTLYLPRGYNLHMLERLARTQAREVSCEHPIVKLRNVEMTAYPKDEKQENGIDFLMETGPYQLPQHHAQLGLNMPTGTGKTFCAICAAVKMHYRPIIICHSTTIRDGWLKSIRDFTTVSEDRILCITGSAVMTQLIEGSIDPMDYDFFVVLHQTLKSFANSYGWSEIGTFLDTLQIGVKILDETHLYLQNMLYIDFYTDVQRTWYLTATFGRSDIQQDIIYHKAYSSVFRFGECIMRNKHTISFIVLIDSSPENTDKRLVEHSNAYGYSATNYMNYHFLGERDIMMRTIKRCLKQSKNVEGIRMILSGLQKSVELVRDEVSEEYPDWTCIANHSKNPYTKEEQEESDCISCTRQLLGTGADIKGLRVLIVTEPMASKLNMEQTMGRLRPYYDSDGEQRDTVFYYIVDTGFRKCTEMYERVFPVIKRLSKAVQIFDLR